MGLAILLNTHVFSIILQMLQMLVECRVARRGARRLTNNDLFLLARSHFVLDSVRAVSAREQAISLQRESVKSTRRLKYIACVTDIHVFLIFIWGPTGPFVDSRCEGRSEM